MKNNFAVLSVSQLNFYVRSILESDAKLQSVFVRGEISNFTNHYRSGHFYLSLKDDNAVIKAVMFRSSAQRLNFTPQNGMKVIAVGRVSVYERDGQYQFYIEDMQPDGIGALHIALEQLKEKLRAEGIFDSERKKSLPKFPQRIGVITSPTGAAIQDILNILKRRWPIAQILVYPVSVQGNSASSEICRAIAYFNENKAADVLIVGRGGGSIEELWAFNEECIARYISASEIPVVSAVGHETDYTIADFTADLRAPTPSAAAELVAPDAESVMEYIQAIRSQMYNILSGRITALRQKYQSMVSARAMKAPMNRVEMNRMQLDYLNCRMLNYQKQKISSSGNALSALAARLDDLSPLKVISRGYTIVSDVDSRIVTDSKELAAGDSIHVEFRDGTADCLVQSVAPKNN